MQLIPSSGNFKKKVRFGSRKHTQHKPGTKPNTLKPIIKVMRGCVGPPTVQPTRNTSTIRASGEQLYRNNNAVAASLTTSRLSVRVRLFIILLNSATLRSSDDAQLEGYRRAATLSIQSLRFWHLKIPGIPYSCSLKNTRNHYGKPLVSKKYFGKYSIYS